MWSSILQKASSRYSSKPLQHFRSSLPVLFIAVVFHIPSFLEPRCLGYDNLTSHDNLTTQDNQTTQDNSLTPYELNRNNGHYNYGYKDAARITIFAAVPFVILVYLYAKIYREVCRVKKFCYQEHNRLKTYQVAILKPTKAFENKLKVPVLFQTNWRHSDFPDLWRIVGELASILWAVNKRVFTNLCIQVFFEATCSCLCS